MVASVSSGFLQRCCTESLDARPWHEFAVRDGRAQDRIVATGWDGLVGILDAGGYMRYDYKTATKLLGVCVALMRDYGGSLDTLHDAAADPCDLERRIKAHLRAGTPDPERALVRLRRLF